MTGPLLQAAAGLVLLYVGGDALIRGASALALRFGVSRLAVGLTIVALGTSAPELVVSLDAVTRGASDIAVGNVVGSNICNIALILGLAALLQPLRVQARILWIDAPLLLLVSLLLVAALGDGGLSRPEALLLVAGLVAYVALTFWQGGQESEHVRGELAAAIPAALPRLGLGALLVALGLGALAAGGHLLVQGAVALATALGVGQALVGLTVVAVGTSLPELATSVIAAARREGDLAVGNVVGSNLFNILGILGITALVEPLPMGGVGWADVAAMLAAALALPPLLYTRLRLARPEGALLLAGYAAYLGLRLAG